MAVDVDLVTLAQAALDFVTFGSPAPYGPQLDSRDRSSVTTTRRHRSAPLAMRRHATPRAPSRTATRRARTL
jgi:hypothetical protein